MSTVVTSDGGVAEQEEKTEIAEGTEPEVNMSGDTGDTSMPEFGIPADDDSGVVDDSVYTSPEIASSVEEEPVTEHIAAEEPAPEPVVEEEPEPESVRAKPPKKEDKATRKADQLAYEEELYKSRKAKKAAQSKPAKPPKSAKTAEPTKAKPAKKTSAGKPTKMSNSEARKARTEMKKNGSHRVVVVSESLGSQLIVLVEVIAGAGLMLFGGAQIANILINNIVSGMLGG